MLGELQPSLKLQIICWTEETYRSSKYLTEDCKLIHDNGSEDILFKSQNWWISQWNKRYDGLPLIVALLLFVIGTYNLVLYTINHYYKKGQILVYKKFEDDAVDVDPNKNDNAIY